MRVRSVPGALIAAILSATPSLACTGKALFSDTFSDPRTSRNEWQITERPEISVAKGYLQIKPNPGEGFKVNIPAARADFDLCVDIIYPQAKKPDGGTAGGIVFWWKDWDNYYDALTTPAGLFLLREHVKGGKGMSVRNSMVKLKTGAGARNRFRFVVKRNGIAIYANGENLSGQIGPSADAAEGAAANVALFAMSFDSEKGQENLWRFSNVRLAEPQ